MRPRATMLLIVLLLVAFPASVFGQNRAAMYNRPGPNSCGQRAGRRCYGMTYNFKARRFCCGGHPYPCNTPAGWNCCGKRLVHSNRHICCSNTPLPRGPNMVCCKSQLMDVTKSVCCEKGQIQPRKGPHTLCCHENSYDTRSQVCCNKKVIRKEYARLIPACFRRNQEHAEKPWHFF